MAVFWPASERMTPVGVGTATQEKRTDESAVVIYSGRTHATRKDGGGKKAVLPPRVFGGCPEGGGGPRGTATPITVLLRTHAVIFICGAFGHKRLSQI